MELYKLRLAKTFRNDLRESYAYIATQLSGPIAASKWRQDIKNTIKKKLAYFPQKYRLIDNPTFAAMGIRRMNVKNHAVLFVIHEKTTCVEVLRIIYARRDLDRILSEEAI